MESSTIPIRRILPNKIPYGIYHKSPHENQRWLLVADSYPDQDTITTLTDCLKKTLPSLAWLKVCSPDRVLKSYLLDAPSVNRHPVL